MVPVLVLLASALLTTAACSHPASSSEAASAQPGTTEPASAGTAPSMRLGGTVAGVLRSGAGGIVVLEAKSPQAYPPPGSAPVMDQAGLTFSPEMLLVRTGAPVEFRNSDDTLHNVHVRNIDTKEPAFNVAIPTGEKYTYTFPKDGFYHVGCDIHPAMSAEIFASSTPFATVAGADGAFRFFDVPPGAYTLRAFLGGGTAERDIDVRSGPNELRIE